MSPNPNIAIGISFPSVVKMDQEYCIAKHHFCYPEAMGFGKHNIARRHITFDRRRRRDRNAPTHQPEDTWQAKESQHC